MSTSFTSALKGTLKSIFRKSTENSPSLPALETRTDSKSTNDDFYQTDENLLRLTSEVLPQFDASNFSDGDSNNESVNNSTTSTSNTAFSLEQELLRNEISKNVSVSEETASEGHQLLSKAFDIPDEILELISPTIAQSYKILPVELVESRLSILFCDETFQQMSEELIINQLTSKGLNYQLHFVPTSEESLVDIIDHVYDSTLLNNQQAQTSERHNQFIQDLDAEVEVPTSIIFDVKVSNEDSQFHEILTSIFVEAHARRATDCNISLNVIPKKDGTEYTELVVTVRIDNSAIVIKRQKMTVETFTRLMVVLKVIAGLDTGKKKGKMTGYIPGRLVYGTRSPKVEMRCNMVPTGKRKVPRASIRFQSSTETNYKVGNIGFFTSDEKLLNEHIFFATDGLIIICGRINCGKNTTLIAFINKLKELHPDKTIILLEDPIEQVIPDVIQIEVDNTDQDFGYSHFLKEALRQDPDILAIGETRDSESAKLVLEAASVGHLTFTTVHGSDSTKVIERMAYLTGDTSKLSDSLRAIISQRLVKRICTKCVREVDTNIPDINRLDEYIRKTGWTGKVEFTRATGKTSDGRECRYCHGKGLYGRIGVFEILTLSEKMRDLILRKAPAYELRKQALQEGLRSVFLNGLVRALMGDITLAQLIKQTGYPNAQKEGLTPFSSTDSDLDMSEVN